MIWRILVLEYLFQYWIFQISEIMTRKHWSGRKLNSTTHRLKPFAINKIPRSGGVLKENRGIKAKCQLAITELANIIFLMNVIIELFSARHVFCGNDRQEFILAWQIWSAVHCQNMETCGTSARMHSQKQIWYTIWLRVSCCFSYLCKLSMSASNPTTSSNYNIQVSFLWEIKKIEKSIEADVALSTSILAFYITDSPLFAQKMCLEDRGRLQTSMIFYMFMLFVAWFVDISNRLTSTQLGSVGVIY